MDMIETRLYMLSIHPKQAEQILAGHKVWEFRKQRMDTLREADGAVLYATKPPNTCLLYTSPSPRDRQKSRMPSSA